MNIFGIGYPRTGTSSLRTALKILGFSKGEIHCGDHMVIPYARFKTADEKHPDGKFIYTKRKNGETWLNSVRARTKVIGGNEGIMRNREKMYGSRSVVPELYLPRYYRREVDVISYFVEKYGDKWKDKLLVICFEINDSHTNWGLLCSFLGVYIPDSDIKFPHLNRSK